MIEEERNFKMAARFVARFVNRNPRNFEGLGMARRPSGYQFDRNNAPRHAIYRVELVQSKQHQDARLIHHTNGVIIEASTKEPDVARQLYSKVDTCAAMNLGRLLAVRALQSGIHFAVPSATDEDRARSEHQKAFYSALEEEGLSLNEPEPIEHSYENDKRLTWRRFSLQHTRQDKIDEDP